VKHKGAEPMLTKGHIYALIICVTLVVVTIISVFGK
jgi:hypothetical protein